MDLSIIIVNWNSREYVRKCVQSIYANAPAMEFEIVVVDGASFDGCGGMLAAEFPRVKFVQSEKNVGFARANNLAFQHSSGGILLFLNPDTEVSGPAIETLYGALLKLDHPGIVGARLLNTDGSLQTSAVQAFPTILNQFLDAEPLRKAFPKSPLWGIAPLFAGAEKPLAVEVLSGACLMLRRDVFEKVGCFSKDYFMYAEDLDLCYKVARLGLKNYHVPAAIVTHHGGGSSPAGRSTFSDVMMRESVYRFLVKVRGKFYGLAFRLSLGLAAAGRLLLLILISPVNLLRGKFAGMKFSIRKWMAILKWTLGLESRTANFDGSK